jgi:WD40 repeat protein
VLGLITRSSCGMDGRASESSFSPFSFLPFLPSSLDSSLTLFVSHRFIASLRGHVAAVYRISWSADSRMLVSASKDSTLKLWDLKTYKIRTDLPGHTDEVYCVDFVADKIASGGRDKKVKMCVFLSASFRLFASRSDEADLFRRFFPSRAAGGTEASAVVAITSGGWKTSCVFSFSFSLASSERSRLRGRVDVDSQGSRT